MSILRWKVHFGTSWRWNWVPTTVYGRGYTCDHIKEMSRIFFSFPSSYNFCISTPIMVKLEMTTFVIRNYSLTGWENLIWFNTLNCLWCWKCCPQQWCHIPYFAMMHHSNIDRIFTISTELQSDWSDWSTSQLAPHWTKQKIQSWYLVGECHDEQKC